MNIITTHPVTFTPCLSAALSDQDGYSPQRMDKSLLEETGRQVKMRARFIAVTALKQFKIAAGPDNSINESELIKLIELCSDGLTCGPDYSPGLPGTMRDILLKFSGTNLDRLRSWEILLKCVIQASYKELTPEQVIYFECFVYKVVDFLRTQQIALHLEENLEVLSKNAAADFVLMAFRDNVESGQREFFESLYRGLASQMARLYRSTCRAETIFNLAKYWSDCVAGSIRMSIQEWLFLISSFQNAAYPLIGKKAGRRICEDTEFLIQSVATFSFCGLLVEHEDNIFERLLDLLPEFRDDDRRWLSLCRAQILLEQGRAVEGATFLKYHIIQGIEGLPQVRADVFAGFSRQYQELCRPLAERNWLDWLDAVLSGFNQLIKLSTDLDAHKESLSQMTMEIYRNLAEGNEGIRKNQLFVQDLDIVVRQSMIYRLYFPDITLYRHHFRVWFVLAFSGERYLLGWQNAKTVVSAIKTYIREHREETFWSEHAAGSEILDEITSASQDLSSVLSTIGRISDDWEEFDHLPDLKCRRDIYCFIYKTCTEYAIHGVSSFKEEVLTWLQKEVFEEINYDSTEVVDHAYRTVEMIIRNHPESLPAELRTRIQGVIEGIVPSYLSISLWRHSDQLALDITKDVYQSMPEYAERSGGEVGVIKCSRDNALSLRRVALSLNPKIMEKSMYFEEWWTAMVNAYVRNRPKKLFLQNRKSTRMVIARQLGEMAADIVDDIISSSLESASTEPAGAVPVAPIMTPLRLEQTQVGIKVPVEVITRARGGWDEFLEDYYQDAITYACPSYKQMKNLPEAVQDFSHLAEVSGEEYLLRIQGLIRIFFKDAYEDYLTEGFISRSRCSFWRRLIENNINDHSILERFLLGLMQASTAKGFIHHLQIVDFIQQIISFNKQCAVGIHLSHLCETDMAGTVAAHLHKVMPEFVKEGVSAPNLQKCTRDIGLLMKQFAESYQTLPPVLAATDICRFLIQQLSPFIAYDTKVWTMTWNSIAVEVGERSEGSPFKNYLTREFRNYAGTGIDLKNIGVITRKFFVEESFIFSADIQEEEDWRQWICLLLSIHIIPCLLGKDKDKLIRRVSLNHRLLKRDDFKLKWETVSQKFPCIFPEATGAMLKELFSQIDQLLDCPLNTEEKPPRLGTMASMPFVAVEQTQDNTDAASLYEQYLKATGVCSISSWSIPLQLHACVEESSVRGLKAQCDILDEIIQGYPSGDPCRRDLVWAAKAILCIQYHEPEYLLERFALWYRSEVLPFVKDFNPAVYVERTHQFWKDFFACIDSPELSSKAQGVIDDLEMIYAGRYLLTEAGTIAEKTTEYIYEGFPEYAQLKDKRALCQRDVMHMTVAIADRILPLNVEKMPLALWWENAVKPYLKNEDMTYLRYTAWSLSRTFCEVFNCKQYQRLELMLQSLPFGQFVAFSYPLQQGGGCYDNVYSGSQQLQQRDLMFRNFFNEYSLNACEKVFAQGRRLYPAVKLDRPKYDLVAGANPAEFVLNNLQVIGFYLAEEYSRYLHSRVLSCDFCDRWARIIAKTYTLHPALEMFLLEIITGAQTLDPLTARMDVIDFLQNVTELTRQSTSGYLLEIVGADIAGSTAKKIHEIIPQHLVRGVSAPSVEKCKRDLTYVIGHCAHVMKTSPPHNALINITSYLINAICPYAGYDRQVWTMVWQNFDEFSRVSLGGQARHFSSLCAQVDTASSLFLKYSGLVRRLFDYESPDKLVNNGFSPVEKAAILEILCMALFPAGSLNKEQLLAEIGRCTTAAGVDLDSVFTRIREILIDENLDLIRDDFDKIISKEIKEKELSGLLAKIPHLTEKALEKSTLLNGLFKQKPSIKDSINGLYEMALVDMPKVYGRWSFDPVCAYIPADFITIFAGLSDDDFSRLKAVIHNLIQSESMTPAAVTPIEHARRLSLQSQELIKLWDNHVVASSDPCDRDQSWLKKRIIASVLGGDLDATSVVRWYGEEVLPYIRSEKIEAELYGDQLQKMIQGIKNDFSSFLSEEYFDDLLARLKKLILSRLVEKNANRVALETVEALSSYKSQSDKSKAQCHSDMERTLLRISLELNIQASGLNGQTSLADWWKLSVRPYLRPEDIAEVKGLHESLGRILSSQYQGLPVGTIDEILSKIDIR